MEAIKKKMQAMKEEQDKAEDKADAKEAIFKVADTRLKKVEAEVALLQQALTDLETEFESEKKVLYVANQTFYKKERQVQRVRFSVEFCMLGLDLIFTSSQNWAVFVIKNTLCPDWNGPRESMSGHVRIGGKTWGRYRKFGNNVHETYCHSKNLGWMRQVTTKATLHLIISNLWSWNQ